jgi:hypothetical protein
MEDDNITSNYPGQAGFRPSGFWAVTPATVLYDPSLPHGAKLLYSIISNLSNVKGYCWASNAYLAHSFTTQERTIIRWLNALRSAGHIIVSYKYFPGSKKIKERRIRLSISLTEAARKMLLGTASGDKNVTTNLPGTDTDVISSTDKNVTTNPAGTDKNVTANPVVLTKMSPPSGDKNVGENDLNSYKAAAAEKIQKPPDDEIEETLAAAAFSKKHPMPDPLFKAVFSSLDPAFVFDPAFYPRAAAFLAKNALPADHYVPWVYKQCLAKKPDSLHGMFIKLFFAPDMAERFKLSFAPPPEPVFVSCPVCGTRYAEKECPQCGLDSGAPPEEIESHKRLWELPPERRTEYERRAQQLLFGVSFQNYDPEQSRSRFDDLKREFGLPVTAAGEASS